MSSRPQITCEQQPSSFMANHLTLAVAGSGKTRVITARIAHLMNEHNVPAHEIVALTFTNKAANEMKERITRFVGEDKPLPFVGTFHSYCMRLLKEHNP